MKHASQWIWGVVAVAALVFIFRPHDDGGSGEITPALRRKPMPEVAMRDLHGATWKLSDRRGKVTLVNFWASWCPPCRRETPGFVRLANAYQGRGLDVAGISMDDTDAPVRRFVQTYHVPYPVLLPPADSPLASAIQSLPTTFLIDKQGRIAKTYTGAATENEVRADIDRLLAEQ
ncbi:MAG: TlpA family protein disulfide reductase [Acidobacteriia bacterium]|nr:TlpA family protein disulfide reductase [Terriglobia bacterium]